MENEIKDFLALQLGGFYLTLGKLDLAEEYLDETKFPGRHRWLSELAIARNDREAFLKHLARALQSSGSRSPQPFVLDESIRQGLLSQEDMERRLLLLESANPRSAHNSAAFTILSAHLALKRGEIEQAITLLENPRSRNIQLLFVASENLATIFLEQGDLAKAAAALEKASLAKTRAILVPNLLSVWLRIRARLARLYRRMGEDGQAQEIENELRQLLVYADPNHSILAQLG